MRLFLPEKGWHLTLHKALDAYPALMREWEKADINPNLIEEPDNETILYATYDIAPLIDGPELKRVREVWFWTTVDPVPLPEECLGEEVAVCMGTSVIYDDYDRALVDLARVHQPVARLLALVLGGPEHVRPLARALLDGDRSAFGPLGDALEEDGHRDTKEIRKLAKAEGKKAKPQGGRGNPLPTAPPAPRRPETSGIGSTAGAQEVVVVGGYPSAGKSTLIRPKVAEGYVRLNRDEAGGTLAELHARLSGLVREGKSVVLDNLYPTRESRKELTRIMADEDVRFRFVHLDTGIEDAMFNACVRMMERHGRVLSPEDMKKAPYKDDPSVYPVAVFYKYRNEFEEPAVVEGFETVEVVKFQRAYPPEWTNKAAIFDFDGTLRTHEGKEKFPCKPSEVRAMKERGKKLQQLRDEGYLLLGASNQSGVAKGKLTMEDARACFDETVRQLGVAFDEILFCPHKVPPLTCYCRKPNPGMGVELIVRHKLDPRQCFYVGDAGTDRTFAEKCGFRFIPQDEYFAG
jgi:HAD superfamily hydrolase (TIGR01662 family)